MKVNCRRNLKIKNDARLAWKFELLSKLKTNGEKNWAFVWIVNSPIDDKNWRRIKEQRTLRLNK